VRTLATAARPFATGTRAIQRTPRLTVLGWHRVDDSGSELSTRPDVFEQQLDALERVGAVVLPLADAVRGAAAGDLPDRAVTLTFDDGYASVLDVAWPRLRERGLPATLFVVSGYLAGAHHFPWDGAGGEHTRLADADAVRVAARDGLDIGSHTVSHRWLPDLPAVELARELGESRRALERLLGRVVDAVAYPVGGWNQRVRDAAARAGYQLGVTVDRGRNGQRADRLALRRAFAPDTVTDFELLLAGAFTWLRPVDRWRMRNGPQW
jgi:peptidoglycan/xylan/chitin deacetylase (PgdA/CDA1 family)